MPKNPEEEKWSQLTDQEERAEEERLKKEEEKIKETGWKKFEQRHKMLKEVAEAEKMKEEDLDQKEAKLTEEREKLPEVYGEAPEDKEKEIERLIKETEDKLDQKLDQERGPSGKKLSDTEIYTLNRNFYLGELGYEIKYRGLLGGKARIWNKEKGGYVIDKKTGKSVEFKTAFSPKGETPFLKFLKEEYKNKIKEDLEKKYQEKAKETQSEVAEKEYQEWQKTVGAIEARKLAQDFEVYKAKGAGTAIKEKAKKEAGEKLGEEKQEIKKTEQASPVESILTEEELEKRARDLIETLDKSDKKMLLDSPLLRNFLLVKGLAKKELNLMTPEEMIKKTKEFLEGESEIANVVTQKEEAKTEKDWKGIDFKKMEADGVFEEMKKMDIEKNTRDIIKIIKDYYSSEVPLPPYAGSLLRKYDQLIRFEQYKFEKTKGNPKFLKEWIAVFLTDIKDSEKVKKLRETKVRAEKKEEKPGEKIEEVKPIKIEELLEAEIERMNRGEVPQSIRPELKQYLIENAIPEDKIDEMIPKEAWLEAIRINKGEDIKQDTKRQEENTPEQVPEEEINPYEGEPEEIPIEIKEKLKGRLRKNKRREANKEEGKRAKRS